MPDTAGWHAKPVQNSGQADAKARELAASATRPKPPINRSGRLVLPGSRARPMAAAVVAKNMAKTGYGLTAYGQFALAACTIGLGDAVSP